MSLTANIDHLVHANGIDAALVRTLESPETFRGLENWQRTLGAALDVFALTEESSVRIVVGKHTVVVQRERHETVAVALPTGHPMAKSLRRMIRRMAKKKRGPLVTEETLQRGAPLSQPQTIERPEAPGRGGLTPQRPEPSPSPFTF